MTPPVKGGAPVASVRLGEVIEDRTTFAQLMQLRSVPDHSCGSAGKKLAKCLTQFLQRRKCRMVVELDVCEHRDIHVQTEHRAVGLVGLHDKPIPKIAGRPMRVLEPGSNRAPDQPTRIEPTC